MPIDSYKWLPYSLAAWMQKYYQGPEEKSSTPFTPLAKPLNETRFALLTTGGLYLKGQQEPFDLVREDLEPEWGDPSFRVIPKETLSGEIAVAHTHYNPVDAEEDFNILLPIHRFQELEKGGEVGSLAPSAYSVMGYQGHPIPDYTQWREKYGPEMLEQMKSEGVEALLLTPAWPGCCKDVLVLARMFEQGGISTILVTMMPTWAEKYGVPRAVGVGFPFGHPLGLPGGTQLQMAVIHDALKVLQEETGPNTIVHLDHPWPGDEAQWRRQWQPTGASPLIAKYLDQIRAMRPRG